MDEVGDPSDLALTTHHLDSSTYGPCSIWLLESGLVVLEAPPGRFSLFESEARARARDHINNWADFARGYWSADVPSEAGLYFVKPLDSNALLVRELKRVNEKLRDVTKGEPAARPGLVTEWRGLWWLPSIPRLP